MRDDELVFELHDLSLANRRWRLAGDQTHPPLIAELYVDVANGGLALPRAIAVGGYLYLRGDAERDATLEESLHAAGALDRMRDEWLPRIDRLARAVTELPQANGEAGKWLQLLGALIEDWGSIESGVRGSVVSPVEHAADHFVDAFTRHHGEQRRDDALALLEGFPSRAAQRDAAVWVMSRLLRSEGSRLSRTFGPTGGQREFMERNRRLVETFGDTPDGCRQDAATWREDRATVERCIVEASIRPDTDSPTVAAERAAERRTALERELRAAAQHDAAAARLLELLPLAQQRPQLRDLLDTARERLVVSWRAMWVTLGRELEARAVLAHADDVFFFERAELGRIIEAGEAHDSHALARRRSRHEGYRAASPPPFLGAAPAD